MTTLTLRYIKGDFVVTGPDIEPVQFKTRREAKDGCVAHYPGSPIKEIGPIYKPPSGATSGEDLQGVLYQRADMRPKRTGANDENADQALHRRRQAHDVREPAATA